MIQPRNPHTCQSLSPVDMFLRMSNQVDIAVIPIAGLGVRFLPITYCVPKELLPIVDKPALLYHLEELLNSGIKEVVLVDRPQKSITKNLFKDHPTLTEILIKQNKSHLISSIEKIHSQMKIHFAIQPSPLGLGHAVLCAEDFVKQRPFALLLADEILYTPESNTTLLYHLIQTFQEHQKSTVLLMEIDLQESHKYGMVSGVEIHPQLLKIDHLVEKPQPNHSPSSWALPGRYVFTPQIFDELRGIQPGQNNEYQLTDAMDSLARSGGLIGFKMDPKAHKRYDTGDRLGYLKANVEFGLRHPLLKEDFKKYLKNLTWDDFK